MGGGTKEVKSDARTQALEKKIAGAYRGDFKKFMDDNMGLIEKQIGSLNDNTMVTTALSDNDSRGERNDVSRNQNTGRYGLGMSPQKRAAMARTSKMSSAATNAGNVNNARLAQQDRNENVAMQLAGQGSALRGQALGEMTQAVGLGNGRARSNAQSAANAQSQNMGTAMSMASMAMMV